MRYLACSVLLGLLAGQVAFAEDAPAINIAKVAKDNFTQIKQLKQDNRKLLGEIEQLQQQQKLNQQKITELFYLLQYRASDATKKAVILKLENQDRAAKKAYSDARSLLATGQYEQTINAFLNYLKRYPDNNQISDVYYWLGKTYAIKADYQNAKKTFTDFQANYSLHPKFANSLYDLAIVQQALNNNQAAVQLLETMIKKFPQHYIIAKAKALLAAIKLVKTVKKVEPKLRQTKTNSSTQ